MFQIELVRGGRTDLGAQLESGTVTIAPPKVGSGKFRVAQTSEAPVTQLFFEILFIYLKEDSGLGVDTSESRASRPAVILAKHLSLNQFLLA